MSNPVIQNIHERRSVRLFDPKTLPQDILETLINSGNRAPSGMNTQGWRFVVVQSAEARAKLSAAALPRYKTWLAAASPEVQTRRAKVDVIVDDPVYYNAPVVLFVIGTGTMTQDYDCPMACENIMLAARSLDIGSCWVYFGLKALEEPSIKEMLGIKPTEKAFGPILLGYPKANYFPDAPPKKPADITRL
jgi:nitroreductase